MPRNVHSHLNPRYKPASVSFPSERLATPSLAILSARSSLFLIVKDRTSFFLSFFLSLPLFASPLVSVAVPLFFYVAPFLSSSYLAIILQSSLSPSFPLSHRCVTTAPASVHHRKSNISPTPTAIFFGHDNTFLRKLIILIVGILRVIFGSTTHFIH